VDHGDGVCDVHITLALHAHDRLHPLANVAGTTVNGGVVLPRQPADSGAS
jgi:hypothetical protein